MLRRALAMLSALPLACVLLVAAPPVPATAAPNCPQQPTDPTSGWAQHALGADRAWIVARGSQQRIAVLDSGVDANQKLLAGKVEGGFNAVDNAGPANTDCLGTGTEVAGVIVGAQSGNSGVVGIAPDAIVVPVRVVTEGTDGTTAVQPDVLARGIQWAVDQHIPIICISVATYADDPAVSAAVLAAQAAGATVIAAVGDRGGSNDSNPAPYPARYRGVPGVSALDTNGTRWTNSGYGGFVGIAAPGAGVMTTWPGAGLVSANGTGIAAGFVAGAAALARSRWHYDGARLRTQLVATATPDGGPADFGAGVVSPYSAVMEQSSVDDPAAPPTYTPHTPSEAERNWAAAWAASHDHATLMAGGAVALTLLVLVWAMAFPRARRRSWRPTLATPPVDRSEPDEPPPPVLLFDE